MDWLDRLREVKAKSNMTTKEIATQSGIPEPTLEKIFAGKTRNPGVGTIQSVVHALGYTLDDIDTTNGKKAPIPVVEDGRTSGNIIKIAGRDGTFQERRLSDEQLAAIKAILNQMPDAADDL